MAWFAAHAIVYFSLKQGIQNVFTVWENVYVIQAPTSEEALKQAFELGNKENGDDNGSLSVDGQPAERVFAGIRKVTAVSHQSMDETLSSGDEITFSEYQVEDQEAINTLVKGEAINIKYLD